MIVRNSWRITCNHTPEVIDRIIMPIRKRGLSISEMTYKQEGERGVCTLDFDLEEDDANRIYKNLIRITDIIDVEKVRG